MLVATLSWRAVLLVNAPLAAVCIVLTLCAVLPDEPRTARGRVDIAGAMLLCVALVGLVFGLSQTQGVGPRSRVGYEADHGQAAIGIALFYAVFHTTYLGQLHERIDAGPLPDLDQGQYDALRDGLQSAEQTGLHPQQFDPSLAGYLLPARNASAYGYSVAFLVTSGLAVLGLIVVAWLVRRPPATLEDRMVREPSTDDPDRDPDLGRRQGG